MQKTNAQVWNGKILPIKQQIWVTNKTKSKCASSKNKTQAYQYLFEVQLDYFLTILDFIKGQ